MKLLHLPNNWMLRILTLYMKMGHGLCARKNFQDKNVLNQPLKGKKKSGEELRIIVLILIGRKPGKG